MTNFSLLVLVAVTSVALAAPTQNDKQILSEIEGLVSSSSLSQLSVEATPPSDKPRPPKLDATISNLRGVMDRLAMENVNSLANREAIGASFASKRAALEALLAPAQQGLVARQEQRKVCNQEHKALVKLGGVVAGAIEHDLEMEKMREDQTTHYTQVTQALKQVTDKNKATLAKVLELVEEEIGEEKRSGAAHFDPVSLRLRQPDDILQHIKQLTTNLGAVMDEKLANQDAALEGISQAFTCKDCEETTKALQTARGEIDTQLRELKGTEKDCSLMAEVHRGLDEADREKVMGLRKELDDLNEAERVHTAAEEALETQRKAGEHVAQKMVGFYQNLPRKSS